MSCLEFEDLILDELDGRITPDTAVVLHRHLQTCEDCRGFLTAQVEIDRSLAGGIQQPVLRPMRMPVRESRVAVVFDFAGVASVSAAAGIAAAYALPPVVAGAPWMIAAAVLCGGAWLTLVAPPTPSA